jgi:hypothetical protein
LKTEMEEWAEQGFVLASKKQPMLHKERFAFNFGFHMGIETAKIRVEDKLKWIREKMTKRTDMDLSAEIKLIDHILEFHENFGNAEVADGES